MALIFDSRWRAIDSSGAPYSGALLYVYLHGTTTLADLFTDEELTTPQVNPVVSDASGRFPQIHAEPSTGLDIVEKTSGGVVITTYENVSPLSVESGSLLRTFAGARLKITSWDIGDGSTGVNLEAGDPSPDNTGGKLRIGGYNSTQADKLRLDAAATMVTGTLAVTGASTFTGAASFASSVTLADGSQLSNPNSLVSQTGRYYVADPILKGPNTGITITANQIYWLPFSRGLTADAIVFEVNTTSAGNARVGIYSANPTTGLPYQLIDGSNDISVSSAGVKVSIMGATHAITSRVWIGFVTNVTPALFGIDANIASNTHVDARPFGQSTFRTAVYGFYSTFTYAALPATAPAIAGDITQYVPILGLRAA